MLTYLLARWRLSRSFEPYGGGYLYRRRPTAEAVLVTAEERSQVFRRFRSVYWKSHAVLWLSFMAGIALATGIAVALDAPDYAATVIGYCWAALLFLAVIYVDRRVFNEAADAIGRRPTVKPARKLYQIQDEWLSKAAWWRLLVGGMLFAILAWLTIPSTTSATWAWIAWFCYFGFFFAMWARNVRRKLRIERSG